MTSIIVTIWTIQSQTIYACPTLVVIQEMEENKLLESKHLIQIIVDKHGGKTDLQLDGLLLYEKIEKVEEIEKDEFCDFQFMLGTIFEIGNSACTSS